MSVTELDALFARIGAGEVWGVGRRFTERLAGMGIATVRDLRIADARMIRGTFSVVLERTVHELRGISCTPCPNWNRPSRPIWPTPPKSCAASAR